MATFQASQTQPAVPGVDFGPTSTLMLVHPVGLVDITNSPFGTQANPLFVAVEVATVTLYSAAQNAVGSSNSPDLNVAALREISIDITTTAQAGTSPTIQFFWDRKGVDNQYYPIWQSSSLTLASNAVSTSVGPGLAYNQSLGATGRLRWVVGGTATPTWTFTPNVLGK